MQLHFTIDGSEGKNAGEALARAILVLCGSSARVLDAGQAVSVGPLLPLSVGETVRFPVDSSDLVHGDPAILHQHDASNVVGCAGQAEITLAPQDDAAALLAQGGALPPSDAGTVSPPATSSGNVVAPPPASSAPTAAPGDAVRLDSAGMPYDVRIHSGAVSQKKDGTWTAKRGVSELLITQIEAEHRAAGYGNKAHAGAVVANVVTAPPSTVAPPPAAAPVVGPPAPAVTSDPQAFKDLVSVMGTAMSSGSLKKPDIDAALVQLGLKAIPELQHRADLIPQLKILLGL